MLADPEHRATLFGTVHAPALSPDPLAVRNGQFNLFVEDDGRTSTRTACAIACGCTRPTDARSMSTRSKRIRDGRLREIWPATTTLFVTVHAGGDDDRLR